MKLSEEEIESKRQEIRELFDPFCVKHNLFGFTEYHTRWGLCFITMNRKDIGGRFEGKYLNKDFIKSFKKFLNKFDIEHPTSEIKK